MEPKYVCGYLGRGDKMYDTEAEAKISLLMYELHEMKEDIARIILKDCQAVRKRELEIEYERISQGPYRSNYANFEHYCQQYYGGREVVSPYGIAELLMLSADRYLMLAQMLSKKNEEIKRLRETLPLRTTTFKQKKQSWLMSKLDKTIELIKAIY